MMAALPALVGVDGDWANIVSGKLNGYMYTKYLEKAGVENNYILRYSGADVDALAKRSTKLYAAYSADKMYVAVVVESPDFVQTAKESSVLWQQHCLCFQ